MSFVPGADGDKSVFKDGIQVDHLSENTVGHGVRVRGISNGDTPAAGDVGEVKRVVTSLSTVTDSTFGTTAALNIGDGVWSIDCHSDFSGNASHNKGMVGFSTDSASSTFADKGEGSKRNALYHVWPSSAGGRNIGLSGVVVRVYGSTLTWEDGTTSTITSGNIYGKGYAAGAAWSSVIIVVARRIA